MNVGEEICGEWLRHMKGCEFVQYNVRTTQVQGEIDVIGINLKERTVYTCEVAVHLVTGLNYMKNRKPANVSRLVEKFRKDIDYMQSTFRDYKQVFMLWSPVVLNQSEGSKHNGLRDVEDIITEVEDIITKIEVKHSVTIEAVVNHEFQKALDDLRKEAGTITKEFDSPTMRYLQIEERLKRHLKLLDIKQTALSVEASQSSYSRPVSPE